MNFPTIAIVITRIEAPDDKWSLLLRLTEGGGAAFVRRIRPRRRLELMASFAAVVATAAVYHASKPFSSFVFVSLHCSSVFTVSANFNEEHTARGGGAPSFLLYQVLSHSLTLFREGGRMTPPPSPSALRKCLHNDEGV